MTRTRKCRDCYDGGPGDRDRPYLGGQVVTKGRPEPLVVCPECGDVVEGVPGIIAHLYRFVFGSWPWENDGGDE